MFLFVFNLFYTKRLTEQLFCVKMVKRGDYIMSFIPYVFSKKDVINNFKNVQQYENWIKTQLRNKKISQVRKGLYVFIDLSGDILSTKFEIASKITEDAFICFHSALEYYGFSNQVFNTITVGTKVRFNNFTFDDIDYIRKPCKHIIGIDNVIREGVRVTSLERTIIDCIDDINAAGGIEEVLNALDQIRILNEERLLEILKTYDSVILYQKVGYILEYFKDDLMLTDMIFDECKKHLTNQVKYFLRDEYKDIAYNSTWKLMAPKNLKSRIHGGN